MLGANTTAVQMAAPVWKLLDQPSYYAELLDRGPDWPKLSGDTLKIAGESQQQCTRVVRKVKNVCAYNPHSCFIVPNQSFDVFSRV